MDSPSKCVAVSVTLLSVLTCNWYGVSVTPGLNVTTNYSANASRESVIYDQCLDSAIPYEECAPIPSSVKGQQETMCGIGLRADHRRWISNHLRCPTPVYTVREAFKHQVPDWSFDPGCWRHTVCLFHGDLGRIQQHFDLVVSACFFGGILLTVLLDLLVVVLQKLDCGCKYISRRYKRRKTNSDQLSVTNVRPFTNYSGSTKLDSNSLILPTETSTDSVSTNGSTPTAESLQQGTEIEPVMIWLYLAIVFTMHKTFCRKSLIQTHRDWRVFG